MATTLAAVAGPIDEPVKHWYASGKPMLTADGEHD